MRFGSDEIFDSVRTMIADPDSVQQYEALYNVIRDDTLWVIRKDTLLPEEREDIVQEVAIGIFGNLVRYAEDFAQKSQSERNGYLYQIIKNKRNDCLSARYEAKRFVSYDGPEELPPLLEAHSQEDITSIFQLRQDLFDSIYQTCSLRTTPDKIIAFLMNKLSVSFGASGRNGTPAAVAMHLEAYSQRAAADLAVKTLETLLGYSIPKWVFVPLYNKLAEDTPNGVRGMLPFQLTVRDITDSSSWITSKMRRQKESIIGGNGYDCASKL